jgi:hypothetical protein
VEEAKKIQQVEGKMEVSEGANPKTRELWNGNGGAVEIA